MIAQCLQEVDKKPDNPRILAFVAFLRSQGYVITLKPVTAQNTPVMRLIEVAA